MRRTLLLSLLAALFLFHFYAAWSNSVNIPYYDDWAFLGNNQLPEGLSAGWLFRRHNEHLIVTTKLVVWALYRLTGWNLVIHQVVNFLLYGVLMAVIYFFVRKAGQVSEWVILVFLIFLLSPINFENHVWPIQTNVHLWIMFFLVAVYFLFRSQTWRDLAIGCASAVLSIYSAANGMAACAALLLCFCVFKAIRYHSQRARQELLQLIAVAVVLGGALALWFVGYQKPEFHHPSSPPYGLNFWRFFLKLIAFAFGVESPRFVFLHAALGLAIFLYVVTPLVLMARSKPTERQWAALAATVGILAAMAAVTYGRAGEGQWMSMVSRYSEFGLMLIPLTLLNWSFFKKHFLFFWLFCFATFFNNWAQFKDYSVEYAKRTEGVECVRAYYEGRGPARCPTIAPADLDLTEPLENARRLGVSFYRELAPRETVSAVKNRRFP